MTHVTLLVSETFLSRAAAEWRLGSLRETVNAVGPELLDAQD